MTPKSLFNIILKIFGLFFLREIINTIPQLLSTFLFFSNSQDTAEGLWTIGITLVILAFYIFLVVQLLFKTPLIVNKLRLDQGFDEPDFSLNVSGSSVLMIALILIGGVILIDQIPNFCAQVFSYFQEKQLTHGITKPDLSRIIIAGAKIIIALLIIGERKRILEFIESRQKKTEE